jgi:hypothetical protein
MEQQNHKINIENAQLSPSTMNSPVPILDAIVIRLVIIGGVSGWCSCSWWPWWTHSILLGIAINVETIRDSIDVRIDSFVTKLPYGLPVILH